MGEGSNYQCAADLKFPLTLDCFLSDGNFSRIMDLLDKMRNKLYLASEDLVVFFLPSSVEVSYSNFVNFSSLLVHVSVEPATVGFQGRSTW